MLSVLWRPLLRYKICDGVGLSEGRCGRFNKQQVPCAGRGGCNSGRSLEKYNFDEKLFKNCLARLEISGNYFHNILFFCLAPSCG